MPLPTLVDGRAGSVSRNFWVGDCCAAAVAGGAAGPCENVAWAAATTILRVARELFYGLSSSVNAVDVDAATDLAGAAAAAADALDKGEVLLVCGVEGKDRAAAVAVAASVLRGASVADAWAAVKAARPTARLAAPRAKALAAALGPEHAGAVAAIWPGAVG